MGSANSNASAEPGTTVDAVFMRRALRLASLSLGMTWPNPNVGCVLVRDGRVIGEGRHRVCGEQHAEVAAIADCRARGGDPAGATVYVTLAPCTRQGRQPPCVAALREARVARVVAAIADPVQDDARRMLVEAGIAYDVGCLRASAALLHGGFLSRVRDGRPRLTGKWAMTLDGAIAAAGGDAQWISSQEALAASRRRRRAFDAIIIGAGTARRDDPLLAALPPRSHDGRPGPVRVVVAARADLDLGGRLARSAASAPVLVACRAHPPAAIAKSLAEAGIGLLPLADPHDPLELANALGGYGFNEVLVEGGAHVHGAFLRAGLYDRLELYLAPRTVGGGVAVAAGLGVTTMAASGRWVEESPARRLGDTWALTLTRPDAAPAVGNAPTQQIVAP